ncbi:MAG TPA: PDZ domain-containing protein [candidate division Zixibacteria bacterium]|nr:PDZ domain-containing protein [candidate division Zixibacteria bacterium]MDD4918390.1 PDZ domain-containing protein [candidate division Zixibacteria bacterium]MDM7972412.1 PDZ domain-containing protein [candidate division Zixibacteria bacterium]HOD66043.1 PDZ domain-containing protein [candidate division Zixibacteria bacterium]HPM38275.1 PDZ domain-containing protein [candidate division Zixibacteria bacterium]
MSKRGHGRMVPRLAPAAVWAALWLLAPAAAFAQHFDFRTLEEKVRAFTVVIDMDVEISFGVHSTEQTDRYLGTIVNDSGLVIFDGSGVGTETAIPSFSGFAVKTRPVRITVTSMDGKTYAGEYLGYDRYTNFAFLQIDGKGDTFTPVAFRGGQEFQVGQWVGLFWLLPEFVSPPLAADVGMVAARVTSPEEMALTVGFSSLQAASVLFSEQLEPVGMLGALADPTTGGDDGSGMLGTFGDAGIPLLGVVTAERLTRLIAEPPRQGEGGRGWLGITLQALTADIAAFWNLETLGGIIVNEVVKGSPAEEAGLEVGDVIFEINGQAIDVDKEEKLPLFQRTISDLGPGAAVELGVLRLGPSTIDTLHVLVTLADAPIAAADAKELKVDEFEFTVRDLVFSDYMIANQDPEKFEGVVVSKIEAGGLAELSGLQIGDVIQRLGSTPVRSVADVESVMTGMKVEKPREVILFVWRGGKTMFVNLKTDWP